MATSPNAVSGLPAGYTLEQPTAQATPPANTGNVSGLPAGYTLETDTQPTTAPAATKETPISQLFGGMHGGSYDIAFRDPQGQISPDTLSSEAVGGTAGIAADALGAVVPAVIGHLENLDKIVKAAKALGYGTFSLKEAHDMYKMFTGDKK